MVRQPLLVPLVAHLLAVHGQALVAGVAGVQYCHQLAGALPGQPRPLSSGKTGIAMVAVQRESLEDETEEKGPQNTYRVWGLGMSDFPRTKLCWLQQLHVRN